MVLQHGGAAARCRPDRDRFPRVQADRILRLGHVTFFAPRFSAAAASAPPSALPNRRKAAAWGGPAIVGRSVDPAEAAVIFHLPRVLAGEQVAQIRVDLVPAAFVDGMQTGGAYVQSIKNNREAGLGSDVTPRLDRIVQAALAANNDFQIVAAPRKVAPFIFSSYTPGLFYGDHTDNAVMGKGSGDALRADLSMTIFLSDPRDYDGGELVIDTDLAPTAYK